MFSRSAFVDLCEQELRLCALSPGENLVVLSQGDERADYVDAFMAAAQRLSTCSRPPTWSWRRSSCSSPRS